MKIQITILCFLLSAYVQSQTYVALNIAEFPLVADRFIGVDDYGSQYYTKGNALFKKSKQGKNEREGLFYHFSYTIKIGFEL